jgi:hypothetical protein
MEPIAGNGSGGCEPIAANSSGCEPMADGISGGCEQLINLTSSCGGNFTSKAPEVNLSLSEEVIRSFNR